MGQCVMIIHAGCPNLSTFSVIRNTILFLTPNPPPVPMLYTVPFSYLLQTLLS